MNYTDEEKRKYNHYFNTLRQTMNRARAGTKFKKELEAALADGYPIDFKHETVSFGNYSKNKFITTLLLDSLNSRANAITQILLDYGADVNIENHNGMNALIMACYNIPNGKYIIWNKKEATIQPYFRYILDNTEDVNKVPIGLTGQTALGLLCCKYASYPYGALMEAIKMLLDAGADPDAGSYWRREYHGTNKAFDKNAEKLEEFIQIYLEQMQGFKDNGKTAVDYEYEL